MPHLIAPYAICVASVQGFHAFGIQHMTVLAVIAVLIFLLAWTAKRATISGRRWLGRFLGILLLSYGASIYIQQYFEHALTWAYSLPLDLCNLALIACIVALIRPNQFAAEIAYFWGLGGVLQATLTPDITQGFPSWEFTYYFWGHGATLLAIVFLISGQGFKPRSGSILRMMVWLNLCGLAVGLMDAVMHWNYGFLCYKPANPSLLDYLGPWPWYLFSIELIAFLTFLILYLPWKIQHRRQKPA